MFSDKARKWRFSISIACLLFLPSLVSASRQDPAELARLKEQLHPAPTVEYCKLSLHRETYDGKTVRVRGVYVTDFEASTISSPDCDVPFSSFVGETWVEFDPTFEKLTERKWRKRLEDSKWRTGLDVVFVGRFESTRHDGIRGFGHQGMYGARFVVMSAEQVQSLGKFSALPGVAVESETALSNPLPQLTLCEALKPDADQTLLIKIAATLDVLKEISLLRDRDCSDQHTALAEFSSYWRASTRPDAAKAIDQKRKRSGTRWPHRGLNSLEIRFERLDVVLEGFLISNPFHKDLAELDVTSELTTQLRARPEKVFFVQRVISAQEPKKAKP